MYDNVCKFLVEHYSQDFAQWLLGEAIGLTQLSPSELFVEPIRADAIILLAAEQRVLHLEFQTRPDPTIPFRLADYRLRLYRRYPQKTMRQVVIYLKPTDSALVRQTTFEISGLRHQFDVIRLWEVPTTELLLFPGLWPLAVLSRAENQIQTLQGVAQRLEALPASTERSNMTAATALLAGLVLDKVLIRQILREEIVKDSVIYQDILQQGLQQGLQREATLVLRQLKHRINQLEPTVESQIRSLSIDQLESLGEALLDFTQPEELSTWLEHNT